MREFTPPEDVMKTIGDGQWRWISELPTDKGLRGPGEHELNVLTPRAWLGYKLEPSELDSALNCKVIFRPNPAFEKGVQYLGMDMYGTYGCIRAVGASAIGLDERPGWVFDWPGPELMDRSVSSLFIRTVQPGEKLNLSAIFFGPY